MEKIKILIADSVEEFCTALADILQGSAQVRIAHEGQQTLELIQSFQPDVLLLDMMMPGLDGISLLKRAAQLGFRPAVLATVRHCSDYLSYSCEQLNVAYIMMKPCDLDATADRLLDIARQTHPTAVSRPDPRTMLSNILLHMGIHARLHGYNYLRDAVLLMMKDPEQGITKELYPAVAVNYSSTVRRVERSIRSAIHSAWKRRDDTVWRRYLPANEHDQIPRPTNGNFICVLADHIALQLSQPAEE